MTSGHHYIRTTGSTNYKIYIRDNNKMKINDIITILPHARLELHTQLELRADNVL